MSPVRFLCLVLAVASFDSYQCQQACDLKDVACTTAAAKNTYNSFVSGIKGLIEPIDPLYVKQINGTVLTFKYGITNVTLAGMRNCDVVLLKYNTDDLTYDFHVQCSKLVLAYYYELQGVLDIGNIDGAGLGSGIFDDYLIKFQGTYAELISEKDQKLHLAIKNKYIETELKGKLRFTTKRLLKGQKAKLDLAVAYLNDNFKAIEKYIKHPIIDSFMSLVIKACDNYLREIPIDEFGKNINLGVSKDS